MELIESEKDQKGPLPQPEPRRRPAATPPNDEGDPNWLRELAILVIAVIIIILLVLLARWIYHEVHHKNNNSGASTSQKTPAKASGSKQSTAKKGGKTSAGSSNKAGSSSQIANTGPGNVVAIFIGSSLAAAGLHYIISVRRLIKEEI